MAAQNPESRFVVLKFGGTSVATKERWQNILVEANKRAGDGLIPVVVCSAITKMTDLLGKLVDEAVEGRHEPVLQQLRARHAELATALGVDLEATVGEELREVERLAAGASLLREKSARLQARTMAMGEILSTKLGAAFFNKSGCATQWVDARTCFTSTDDASRPEAQRLLNATVSDDRDAALTARFEQLVAGGCKCIVTQGFIAKDAGGGTVLLGRGGSDTSASYFAAKLHAQRCEIWTDVPGIFSADPRVLPQAVLVKTSS
jgi:diaminopimelate decarboxylase/aspartate kinase